VFAREHKAERSLTNFNEVIRNTLALRAYQLRVDNIDVKPELDPNLPMTVVDPYQMQQVILNLINNAHHAITERGKSGRITLRTGLSSAQNGSMTRQTPHLFFSISDTGVGIPERALNKIFDPFYTTKPVGQGTGLGLSICYGIVKEHGGRIWAESEMGVGTTVTIELPLLQTVDTQPDDSVNPTAVEAESLPSCRILVVDDEEPVSHLLARLLRDLGHQPVVVHSGNEALTMLANDTFDLILTDVKMPGMSGFELHQQVKQRDAELATRFVFVTGDTMSAATQARIAQSGNPSIAKPFTLERLEAVVRELLARRPMSSA
jgi:two-component system NtrC family sensor kinase